MLSGCDKTKDQNIHQEIVLIDAIRYINQNVDDFFKDNENFENSYIDSIKDFTGKEEKENTQKDVKNDYILHFH